MNHTTGAQRTNARYDKIWEEAKRLKTETRFNLASCAPEQFSYSSWRHGGWYVHNVRYPSGAIGCVSRNYADRKWRIVCDPRPFEQQPTFKCRDDAARAEWHLAQGQA